jgi:hypothetical protein
MNVRRGLFRLWLVASVLWALGVGLFGAIEIWRIFDSKAAWANAPILYPVACDKARGAKGIDYEGGSLIDGPWDRYTCWYSLGNIRKLYPEYADASDDILGQRLYEAAGRPLKDRWSYIGLYLMFALIPPAVLLAIGSALVWALSGFRRAMPHPHPPASGTHTR